MGLRLIRLRSGSGAAIWGAAGLYGEQDVKKRKQTETSQQMARDGAGNATKAGAAAPEAASPGLITWRDTGAGSGEGAMTRARPATPIDSSLLGESPEPRPAAEPRQSPAGEGAVRRSVPAAGAAMGAAGTAPADAPTDAASDTPRDAASPVSAPAPASAAPVQIRRTGFWPVVLGGVVAAGIGAGATIWALPHLPPAWLPAAPEQPGFDAEGVRAEAVAAAQDSAQQLVDDFAASFEPPAPAEGADQAALADLDALRQDLADLRARVDDQGGRLDDLQTAATDAAPADTDTAAEPQLDPQLEQQLADLSRQAEELAQLEQRIQETADEVSQQIAAARAEAEQMQAQAAEGTRRAEAVAAIASLQAALDRGISADQARDALNEAGIETPEVLAQDVPSLDDLQADFPDAARAALRASLREDSASGSGNVLTNFLRAQTGARSVAPREGSDPDAILSRADAAVEAGRIGDALTEMQGLPETARDAPAMAEWLRRASIWHDAQAALSDLSATTN